MKVKQFIKEFKLADDDVIFIHIHGKAVEDPPLIIKDIPDKLLNKKIEIIQPKQGGNDYDYNCYKLIVK